MQEPPEPQLRASSPCTYDITRIVVMSKKTSLMGPRSRGANPGFFYSLNASDEPGIGIGERSDDSATPATPPGVRVRTGRFDELRSCGQPRNAQLVEVTVRQRAIEEAAGGVPPPPGVASNHGRLCGTHPTSTQLAVDHWTMPPVFQM